MFQNATTSTWANASEGAATEDEGAGDVYTPLDDDATAVEAQQAGQPLTQAQTAEEEVDEKYRGKSIRDLARMHAELEKKLGADAEEKARIREEIRQSRSEAERARAQFEMLQQQLLNPRNAQPQNHDDPLKEKFRKTVADDDAVFSTVQELASHTARQSLTPELQRMYQEIATLRAQNFNAHLDNLKKADPEFDKLFPEVQKQGEQVLTSLSNVLRRVNLPENYINVILGEVNADTSFLPILKNAVIGSKGPEYYKEALKQKQKSLAEDDAAKNHLGGGSTAEGPTTSSDDEALRQLLDLDSEGGLDKAREILIKKGVLSARRKS